VITALYLPADQIIAVDAARCWIGLCVGLWFGQAGG
jgi:hypothetical protein